MGNKNSGKSVLSIVRKYHPQVTRVVDAKNDAEIEVTRKDCSSAKKGSPSSCAMARAFEREYDGAIVSLSSAYLVKGKKAIRYRVPNSVQRELVSFDRNRAFAPGEYKLKAPSPARTMAAIKARNHDYDKRARHDQNTTKRTNHHTAGIRAL